MSNDESFDVVVVGGGLAGLTAANRAAQLGLSVALLERGADERYHCNSRFSGGILHISFRNIREPQEDLYRVAMEATRGYSSPDLLTALTSTCGRAVDWLQAEGAKFIRVGQIVWQQWVLAPPRPLTPGLDWMGRGPDVTLRTLTANLEKRGGRVMRGTEAVSLIAREGQCVGVEAASGGARRPIAARAVVLADGGFQANLELIGRNITPDPGRLKQRGAATGIGDGLRMAQALGAATSDLKCFYGHLLSRDSFTNDKVWPYPQLDELGTSGIIVDNRGERVMDEGLGGVYCANSVARLADPLSTWALFDEAVWDGPGRNARIPANPNLVKAGGTVLKESTLAALAAKMGIPAAALESTVRAYNAAHAAGKLGELPVPRSTSTIEAFRIEKAPFYAVPLCAGITYTMGGIAIDADGRVLRPDRAPIGGLYAAGATTGGIEGGEVAGYVGGLIKAAVFGLRAAEHIGQAAKR